MARRLLIANVKDDCISSRLLMANVKQIVSLVIW